MNGWAKPAVAEFIGAFGLTFMGAGSIVATQGQNLPAIAFAHGLAIALGVLALGKISGGHFNPAVTIAFLVTNKISVVNAIVYIVSQLLGAVFAGFAVLYFFPPTMVAAVSLGNPELAPGVSFVSGVMIEMVLTFFLVLVIFGTAVDSRGLGNFAGFAIGLTITMDIFAAGPLTGAAMNPSRAFGTAVPVFIAGGGSFLTNHLVYWVGPIVGGAFAGLLYDLLFMEKQPS